MLTMTTTTAQELGRLRGRRHTATSGPRTDWCKPPPVNPGFEAAVEAARSLEGEIAAAEANLAAGKWGGIHRSKIRPGPEADRMNRKGEAFYAAFPARLAECHALFDAAEAASGVAP